MAQQLNLIHLANLNSTNIGNGALIYGLERIVNEDFPVKINWHREPWDDYTFEFKDFDQSFVDLVNMSDGLFVGGAVAIHGRRYVRNAGMRFDLPAHLWAKFKKPIVFYGISYRHWLGQEFHHLDKLKEAISIILDHPRIIFAVRNDGTKEWLQALLGFQSDRIYTIPDTGVYVPYDNNSYSELSPGKVNVILAFNDEDRFHRFGDSQKNEQEMLQVRLKIVNSIAVVIEKISTTHDLNLILCPHYFDDYRMISDFISYIRPQLAHQQMVSTGLNKVSESSYFYGRYAKADIVVSMRVHSMSPSIGMGVPMVALTSQNRMTRFLQEVNLADCGVSVFDENFEEKFYTAFMYTLNNPDAIREKFAASLKLMRKQSKEFNAMIFSLLFAPNQAS